MSHHLPSCALALCVGALAGGASAQFVPLFAAPTSYLQSFGAPATALGDVDGDGEVDLVEVTTIFLGPSVVRVTFGAGEGTFGATTTYELDTSAFGLALGDVSGDGHPDLVLAASGTDSVLVMLNDGSGAFGAASSWPVGDYPFAVALGDLNGDGQADIAVANDNSGTVSVLLGTGGGSFGAAASYGVASSPLGVVAADMNGDGRLDLVLRHLFGTVSVLPGQPGGTFGAAAGFASGAFPGASLAVGDLSGDGKPDVAVTADDSSAPGVVVMLGTGGGALGPPTKHALSGQHAQSVAMADFDADGHLDLAVGNSSFTVAVLLGLGGGALAPAKDFASESHDAPNVVIGDISGDGRPDIVASGGNASVLLNQNPNIGPWTDLGFGLAGLQGIPIVLGSGTLQANAPGAVTLSNTEASARAFLFVSLSSTPTPFHGGTLAAFPSVREFGLATDAGGKAAFPFTWPAGIPAAADFYFQFAVKDPAGPQGVTLSNALRAVTP